MPFLGSISTTEWIIIGLLVFFFFGSKKLTELARGLGESGKELKRVKKEFHAAIKESADELPEDSPKVNHNKVKSTKKG